jgi:hypothetical protein
MLMMDYLGLIDSCCELVSICTINFIINLYLTIRNPRMPWDSYHIRRQPAATSPGEHVRRGVTAAAATAAARRETNQWASRRRLPPLVNQEGI